MEVNTAPKVERRKTKRVKVDPETLFCKNDDCKTCNEMRKQLNLEKKVSNQEEEV